MTMINTFDRRDIETRFPELLHRTRWQRFGAPLVVIGTLLYVLYAVWFFNLPKMVNEAHWERFSIYLLQWVSYDVQPQFRVKDNGTIDIRYPRFSVLGDDPKQPDWIKTETDGSYTVTMAHGVHIGRDETVVNAHGTSLTIKTSGAAPAVVGAPPSWVNATADNVQVDLGLSGWLSIDANRVKVVKRFFGWPNFIFDPTSPFFGKSTGEVVSLIVSGDRLDPSQSNLSLAFDNFWNNTTWQHGDVWTKLFQTIVMAFLGTLLGAVVGFPLAFLAARNITPNRYLNAGLKRFFDFMRSVDMLIWGLFLTRAFGPGPLSGSGAIFLMEVGSLGKLYAEALENIDNKPREGIRSVGASPIAIQRYGVLPQVMPVFAGQTLYQWESNIRGATIIGAIGAGGIGLKIWEAMRTNDNWQNVAYMVVLLLIVVYVFDMISNKLRSAIVGEKMI
ncbi:MAG TPA: phosphonate ABC transporter, permease protein PhnE [Ensifer sp.]|nr:phosphonate ABC transporter, permease protein PhnE [Ensifer sp.]